MDSRFLLVLPLFLLCVHAADCPPFANLTSPELLAAVAPECFAAATAADIAEIPGDSCGGFTTAQAQRLASLSSHTDACAGLSAACARSLSVEGAAGLSTSCVLFLNVSTVAMLNASQVAAVPASSFAGFQRVNVAGLGASCAGLTADQTGYLGSSTSRYDVCYSLSATCGAAFSVAGASGLITACTSYAPPAFLGALNVASVAAIQPSAFMGFSKGNIVGFGAGCAGFTANQVGYLGSSSSRLDVCFGITTECGKAFSTDGLSGIETACTMYLNTSTVAMFSAAQVAAIKPSAFMGFSKNNIAELGDGCAGLTADQTGYLGSSTSRYDVCYSLSATCGAAFSVAGASGLITACTSYAPPAFLGALSNLSVAAIQPSAFMGFSKGNIVGFGAGCAGFTAAQAGYLGSSTSRYDVCFGITTECGKAFSIDGMSGIETPCTTFLNASVVAVLSAAQVAAIKPSAFMGFSKDNIAGLGASCAGITAEQASYLGSSSARPDVCFGATIECGRAFSIDGMSGLETSCVSYLHHEFLGALSLHQVAAIKPSSFMGFSKDNIFGLGVSCAGITSEQASYLGSSSARSDVCYGVTTTCSASFSIDGMSGIETSCVSYLKPSVVSAFTANQVAAIKPSSFMGFNKNNIAGLTTACSGFNASQVSYLGSSSSRSDVCEGIRETCLEDALVAVFPGFQSSCTSRLAPEQLDLTSAEKINAMCPSGLSGFSAEVWLAVVAKHGASVVDILTAEQLKLCHISITADVNRGVDNRTVAPFRTLCPLPQSPLNWLQLAFSEDAGTACLTSALSEALPASAWMGLRVPQVKSLSPAAVGAAVTFSCEHFTTDAVAALDRDQVSALSPGNFSGLGAKVLQINHDAALGISPEDIWALWWQGVWDCDLAHALREDAKTALVCRAKQLGSEDYYTSTCKMAPCSNSFSSEGGQSDGHRSDSNSNSHKHPGSKVGLAVGLSFLGAFAVACIAAGIYIFLVRRRRNSAYVSL